MVLHGFNKQSSFEGFIKNPIIETAISRAGRGALCLIHARGDAAPWLQPRETTRELAPADFSAFSHRDRIHDKNPLRHLPTTQFASAKFQ